MIRPAPLALLAGALVAPLACTGDVSDAAAGSAEPAEWTVSRDVRIGGLDGPGALSRVADVTVAGDGRVYVLLPQEQRVAVFGPDGAEVRSIGREGEGPGELLNPSAAGFVGDTLWISDGRQRRVSLYTSDGTHIDDVPWPTATGLAEGLRASFGAVAADGRVIMPTSAGFGSPLEGTDHPYPLLSVPRDGGAPDTLVTRYLAHDRAMFTTASGGQIQSVEVFTQIFTDATLWALGADDRSVVVVDRRVADGSGPATYGLLRVGLGGDTLFDVRVPYDPVSVDPVRVDSILARYTRGGRSESDIRSVLFLPERLPPASRVLVGSDGRVWVGREARQEAPLAWDVFDPSGTQVARVETPAGFRAYAAMADGLWGVETDELDVPYVVRYRVVE